MKQVFAKDVNIGLEFANADVVAAHGEAEYLVQIQDGKNGDVSDLSYVIGSL